MLWSFASDSSQGYKKYILTKTQLRTGVLFKVTEKSNKIFLSILPWKFSGSLYSTLSVKILFYTLLTSKLLQWPNSAVPEAMTKTF